MDMQAAASLSCPTGQVTGSLQVTGSWTGNSNGSYTDKTVTKGNLQIALGPDCLILSLAKVTCAGLSGSLAAAESFVCTDDTSTGGCNCTATLNQEGWPGMQAVDAAASGNYTASNNTVTLDSEAKYSYCVAGSQMTWTPQTGAFGTTVTGTVVFQNGSTGTGGSPASGGASGKGGGTGAGGSTGTGGKTGAGGATGPGGATGGGTSAGGKTGSGGATLAGGTSGSGGTTAAGGSTGTGTRGQGPCDVISSTSLSCGAAYSTVRALTSKYTGPLYQVRSGSSATNTGSGGTTQDIGMLADGYADSGAQDTFCANTTCSISKIYDQTGNGNDLTRGSAGPSGNGNRSNQNDYESVATTLSITAGGHKVYALYVPQFGGYRTALNATGKGIPIGAKDQTIYSLGDGTHTDGDGKDAKGCCNDFGSVSPDPNKYVTMTSMLFGRGFWGTGDGSGPWFEGDFEGGVWSGGSSGTPGNQPGNPSLNVPFALGFLHTTAGKYALRMADTASATAVTTAYNGAAPSGKSWSYAGGIGLGIGGDNSNNAVGTYYECAVLNGWPSDDSADNLILKNIQAVGYKK